MSSLFRKEAVERRGQKFSNPIKVEGVPTVNKALAFFGVFFVGLVIFGLKFDYQRKVDVNGYLAPEGGAITLTPDVSGVLNIRVANGATIKAGEQIATLRSEKTDAAGQSRQSQDIASLERRLDMNTTRATITNRNLADVMPNLEADLAMLMDRVRNADSQLVLAEAEFRLANGTFEKMDALMTRGLITGTRHAAAEQAKIASQHKVLSSKAQINSLMTEITQRRKAASELRRRLRQELITLNDEQEVISGSIRQIKSDKETAITAPVGGVLTYVQAQQFERATASQPLFKIRPEGADQTGVLLAPSWAIGFLNVGDVVRIRYRAFPYQEYGVFEGRVTSFDEAAQAPSEIDAPMSVSEPVFRVFVELDQSPTSKGGQSLRLSQGMIFEASVVIDKRPVIWWLLDPVV